jgi:hypothetical protein
VRDLPLQRLETSRGPVYLTEERWPLDYRHGRLPLGSALALNDLAISRLAPRLSVPDLIRAAFVDVETTGLAGGTGTYAFLVGLGTFEDCSFRLRQFFLAQLDGEAAMLSAVSDALADCGAVVTFNGRRFDLPLLETRFTLSRLPPPTPGLPHLDLLYPARRLYRRRLPSCRLASLEEAVLGVQRHGDLPGWAIPSLYFDYVREGSVRPLSDVFRHNALDILSLVVLLGHLGRFAGRQSPTDPRDSLALARWDESEGRLENAARLYEAALGNDSNEGGRTLASRNLTRLYRRLGRWQDQARVARAWVHDSRVPDLKLEALVALAKLEEHRHRDYSAAETLTRQAISLVEVLTMRGKPPTMPPLRREALEHRLWRLRRRLGCAAT